MTAETSRSTPRPPRGDETGEPVTDQLELAADATAPRRARNFVGSFSRGLGGMVDNTQLLVSELVSNVVRHTHCETMTLSLTIRPGGIHVEVCDCDRSRFPTIAPLRPTEPGGIGLRIVDELSDEWGTHETDHGKCVWFDMSTPPTASSGRERS